MKTVIIVEKHLEDLRQRYQRYADPANAVAMERYMKDQYPFWGVKTPQRLQIVREWLDSIRGGFSTPDLLTLAPLSFEQPEREFHYLIYDILRTHKRWLVPEMLPTFSNLIGVKSWWDTVDFLGPKLCGPILKGHPELIKAFPLQWIESDNIWYQRAAILFQLGYKTQTDAELLFSLVRRRANSREFFVQKGAGWALREYAKTNPVGVRQFLESTKLPSLTIREAGKNL